MQNICLISVLPIMPSKMIFDLHENRLLHFLETSSVAIDTRVPQNLKVSL